MNTLEYIIKLRDQFSTGLMGIAQKSNRTFSDVQRKANLLPRSVDQINRRLDELQKVRKLSVDLSQIRKADAEILQLKSELRNINGASAAGGGGGMGIMGMAGRYFAPAAIGAAVFGAGKFAVGGGAQREQQLVGLRTFLGGDAERVLGNITQDANVTPYDVDSLLTVNRALISAGEGADNARKTSLALANAISAVGGGNDELQRMAANLQQIRTVGKATAMDVRQFGMTGINIYKLLSDYTGKNIAQVKEMDVTYQQLSGALQKAAEQGGMYFGALEAQSQTLQGRWDTMWDNLKTGASEAVMKIQPLLSSLMGEGGKLGVKIGGAFKYIADWVNFGFWKIVAFHAKVMQFATSTIGLFQVLKDKLLAFVDVGIQKIGNLLEAINKFVHFDFSGAKAAWNRQEFSGHSVSAYYDQQSAFKKSLGFAKIQETANWKALIAARGGNPFSTKNKNDNLTQLSDQLAMAGGKEKKDKLAKAAKPTADSITGGGARNVYVNLGKFMENFNINTTNIKAGADETQRVFEDMFLRLLNSAGAMTN